MEEKIALYMKNLGLTEEEARQLIADDENDISVDLTADQKEAVKQMTQADHKPHGNHRKPDENKRALVTMLETFLLDLGTSPVITNPERELEFDFMGSHYRLTLAKPRK